MIFGNKLRTLSLALLALATGVGCEALQAQQSSGGTAAGAVGMANASGSTSAPRAASASTGASSWSASANAFEAGGENFGAANRSAWAAGAGAFGAAPGSGSASGTGAAGSAPAVSWEAGRDSFRSTVQPGGIWIAHRSSVAAPAGMATDQDPAARLLPLPAMPSVPALTPANVQPRPDLGGAQLGAAQKRGQSAAVGATPMAGGVQGQSTNPASQQSEMGSWPSFSAGTMTQHGRE